jgi:hypothetical protein
MSIFLSLASCSLNGDAKLDKDGNVIIKGKDGSNNEVIIGQKTWEKSKMHGLDAPKARLDTSLISNDGAVYGYSAMEENDAKSYIEAIKSAGFIYNSATLDDYFFTGMNKEGLTISFSYDKETKSGSIMSGIGEPPSDDETDDGAIIGGDNNKKWDSVKMGGLPDPGVNIILYWTANGDTNYNLEVIPSYTDYIQKIKACGYTESIDEIEINNSYIYCASNIGGDRVTFSVTSDMTTILFEKRD